MILNNFANKFLLTTESVSEGHPDKIADQVAEAICDLCLVLDPNAHVACEVFITSDAIFIGGELKSKQFSFNDSNFKKKVENVFWKIVKDEIGFDESSWGSSWTKIKVKNHLHSQSEEINHLIEKRDGAGDNSTVFGHANSDLNYFPVFQHLANKVLKRINLIRKTEPSLQKELGFGPDGKIQVLFCQRKRKLAQIVLCQQFVKQFTSSRRETIKLLIKNKVIKPILTELDLKDDYNLILRDFFKGGPVADSGLTGRKLMVDNYGVFSFHGGGSFAGKDPSKPDRSLALFARFVAKHIVASKIVDEITIQISSIIGQKEFVNITPVSPMKDEKLLIVQAMIKKFFLWDLDKVIKELDLLKTKFLPFASYGYFGRSLSCSWEKLTYLQAIKEWMKANNFH